MLSVSVIILTFNEELHIRRCLENVRSVAQQVFVVDSFSKDKTVDIATELGAEVVQHEWPGNQAEQFNWALENLPIQTDWILRMDADEFLTPELKNEMQTKLPVLSDEVSAVVLPLGRMFQGRLLKHGIVNGVKMIRLFRKGRAWYEVRLMDEHLLVNSGTTINFECKFIDDNLQPIHYFIAKHNGYSVKEAIMLLDSEYHLIEIGMSGEYCEEVRKKREEKLRYARMPLFWRVCGYFIYRYIIKLGFLDGKEGFLWDFFQGLWYRMLVDAKVYEIKKACGSDKDRIREYLSKTYQINI